MPQNSQHPLYQKLFPQWQRCRAATEGGDAIKDRGELDLPRPSGLTDVQYQAYKTRAPWFNASSRTLEGWTAPVFRKPPVIMGPPRLLDQLQDVTGTGMTFHAFAFLAFEETFRGHAGILLDLPAQEIVANAIAPQWTCYQAEQIINWEVTRQEDGTMALTHVMLQETVDERDPKDRYAHVSVMQWRELAIIDNEYTVTVWRRSAANSTGFAPVQGPYTPNRMQVPLKFIPFELDLLAASMPPPLLDIVDMNLAHYRSGADYKHALHWTGMKTPWLVADVDLPLGIQLGGVKFLHIKAPASEVAIGLLEPNGDSLQAQLDDLKAMEQQMAVLGARMLEPQKRSAETAEAMGMRQSGEQSVLQDAAQTMSQRLTRALRWHAWWAGLVETPDDESISVQLNMDLVPRSLAPQELDALAAVYHQGIMTQESVYYNLHQGEMLAPGEEFEDYVARLATQAELREPVVGGNLDDTL